MNTYSEARTRARRDAAEVLEEFGDRRLPVDPVAIARAMGIQCYSAQLGSNVSGMIQRDSSGQASIYVDIDDGPRRSRFTIAHELGHYADHMWRDGDGAVEFVDRRDGTSNVNEFYANEFAGSLLMPESSFAAAIDFGMSDSQLADHFQVSTPAVRVRKQTLGL
ncbi:MULTISPECIES: ImmA/IrrE family metallo-endopeptidase [Arthrobacter]|uniref:ImmA/IrrE family metallo-endopeptidase n=2 Tax=Arthrobacter TaxID=1663 RepID=A0ABU9KHK9_9MICC|nr:ImmA/IrrE family metallo-endopeptidase [Arthrobacter sp. YJM1]MDP5226623.1 ImmA/IrrE family metallo-endopeptidase [Arthrobacter sp. YJM1]